MGIGGVNGVTGVLGVIGYIWDHLDHLGQGGYGIHVRSLGSLGQRLAERFQIVPERGYQSAETLIITKGKDGLSHVHVVSPGCQQ